MAPKGNAFNYPGLPLAQVITKLRRRFGSNETLVQSEYERIKALRSDARKAKIKATHVAIKWRHLLTPLSREISNAKVCAAYTPRWGARLSEEDLAQRREVWGAYTTLLLVLRRKFQAYIAEGKTPNQLYKERLNTANPVEEDGEHWADWVPERVKAPMRKAFGEIPRVQFAKSKEPFERRFPPALQRSRRGQLENEITKERELRERTLSALIYREGISDAVRAEIDDERQFNQLRLDMAIEAMRRLRRFRAGRPLPTKWFQIFTEDEQRGYRFVAPAPNHISMDKLKEHLMVHTPVVEKPRLPPMFKDCRPISELGDDDYA